MRVLQVTKYFHPHQGGIESNVLDIIEGAKGQGIEFLVATTNTPKTSKKEDMDGVKILRSTSLFTLSKCPFAPGILKTLFSEDYDIIHLHLPDPVNSIFVWAAAKLLKKPFVVTYHADIIRTGRITRALNRVYDPILIRILKDSDRIFATSPNYARESKILGTEGIRDKLAIIPNFIDAKKFKPRNRAACLEKLGLGELEGKKIILFLGRLVPYKGVEYLIRAFPKVKEKVPKAFLLIVGDGELRDSLNSLAKGIPDVRIMKRIGGLDDSSLYYPVCDVFALPSVTRQEAFGITLLEAMASEKPCVTTNISGMPYVVGETGLLAKPRDPEDLADRIILLLKDQQKSNELGRSARLRVESEFDREDVIKRIADEYKQVLS